MGRMYSEAEVTALRHEIGYLKAERIVADKGAELLNRALTNAENEAERFRQSAARFKRRAEAAEAALAQGGVTEGGDGEAGSGPEGTSTRSRSDAPHSSDETNPLAGGE